MLWIGSSTRRRLEAVGAQDPGDGAGRDPAAKAQQLPADALVAPPWVLGGQPNDQALDLVGNGWPAAWPGWIGPVSAHHAAVPSKQRLGRDQRSTIGAWAGDGSWRQAAHGPGAGAEAVWAQDR
jgi:hypothetical protein